jgi:RecA-family ATPase
MMAPGGSSKTILCCGIAAAISTGLPLPGDNTVREPKNIMVISAEEDGEMLKVRLRESGADLTRCFILDRKDSEGMNFDDQIDEFTQTVMRVHPSLVIIDPWHAFIGRTVDVNRVNVLRPILQKLSNLAKSCQCAIIAVSHVNKKSQAENTNNAALGSVDFINAARSALQVVFSGEDPDSRVLVHTKANYSRLGPSIQYRITKGGVVWDGYSEINKELLERAARERTTPSALLQKAGEKEQVNQALLNALKKSAESGYMQKYGYQEFQQLYGESIFGCTQPKRALDAITEILKKENYFLKTGEQKKVNGHKENGFIIQRIVDNPEPQATEKKTTIPKASVPSNACANRNA